MPILTAMELDNFMRTDPHLLVGIVNTALRNEYDDLDDLCKSEDIDRAALENRLQEGGYNYLPEQKRFS